MALVLEHQVFASQLPESASSYFFLKQLVGFKCVPTTEAVFIFEYNLQS